MYSVTKMCSRNTRRLWLSLLYWPSFSLFTVLFLFRVFEMLLIVCTKGCYSRHDPLMFTLAGRSMEEVFLTKPLTRSSAFLQLWFPVAAQSTAGLRLAGRWCPLTLCEDVKVGKFTLLALGAAGGSLSSAKRWSEQNMNQLFVIEMTCLWAQQCLFFLLSGFWTPGKEMCCYRPPEADRQERGRPPSPLPHYSSQCTIYPTLCPALCRSFPTNHCDGL